MAEEREGDMGEIGREKKKKKNRAMFSLLTEDLIIDEILLKLPVNSLLRLRCVSRYFHSLITSPSFIRKHLDHHNSSGTSLLLITCRSNRCINTNNSSDEYQHYIFKEVFQHFSCNFNVDDPSLPEVLETPCPFESVGIYGSCNGLLFLHTSKKRSYIWNPCTKEYKELSTPSIIEDDDEHFCGFGYDRTTDEYKILYCVSITEFKLYKLGSGTWKSISDNPYSSLFSGFLWRKSIGLLVNGALHWIRSSVPSSSLSSSARNAMISVGNAMIISFDMEKEEFREVQKPHYSTRSLEEEEYYYGELQVLRECLCLCRFPKPNTMGTFDIWMLKDYTVKDSWTKLFTIVMPDDLLAIQSLKLLRFCENGEIVMLLWYYCNHLIVYDPVNHHRSRLVENIDETTINEWAHEVVYRESLVSLNSGTYTI